jgi:hypothetical protein
MSRRGASPNEGRYQRPPTATDSEHQDEAAPGRRGAQRRTSTALHRSPRLIKRLRSAGFVFEALTLQFDDLSL